MKTLIVEDSSTLCAIYQAYLEGTGLDIHTVETLADALQALDSLTPELILLDIELPDGNGLDLLAETSLMNPPPAVVVMTGHGAEYSEQAMARGAVDFLHKPFDASRLRVTLNNAAAKIQLSQQLRDLSTSRERLGPIIGGSAAMQAVYDAIDSLSGSRATAFITGESGTGKELAARAIHDMSARAQHEFVVLNCAAIPGGLIESELFGVAEGVRGSQQAQVGLLGLADGGTLFIDEVCDMPYEMQTVLLRFIQEGTFKRVGSATEVSGDVRIIASTNRDPLFEMREGRLREDLFYRLHVVPLRIPPLRERGDDVIALATHFLAKFCEAEGKETENFSDECVKELLRYPWPGNVRQLENIVHRVVLMTEGGRLPVERLSNFISDSDLGDGSRTSNTGFKSSSSPSSEGGGFDIEPLWMTEKRAIQAAIDSCEGNINKAAGLLEVAPSTIYRKIQSWKASGDI